MSEEVQRTISSNGGTLTPFSHASARLAAQKSAEVRRNKAAQAARNRTVARLAASDPTIQSSYDAWGALVADQAEALRQAASEGKPRADDLIQIGRALGMVAQAGDKSQPQQDGVTVHVSADVARQWLLAHAQERLVIDAQAEDTGDE